MILNIAIILFTLFGLLNINRSYKLKLENEKSVLVDKLKNKHLLPEEEVSKAFFDNREILWILVKDKNGKETAVRADGKSPETIEDDYEYQFIRDNTRYPI